MNLSEDALNYKNQWVAFSGDLQRVVGHGLTSLEAQEMAQRANQPHAFLLFIPEKWPNVLMF
jgi:hypothetical protein